jgi:hypothetical protein
MFNIKYLLLIGFIINIGSLNASLFSSSSAEVNSEDLDEQECITMNDNNKPIHLNHQTLIANMNDSVQDDLKHTFKTKVDCLANVFNDNLNEMNKLYSFKSDSSSSTLNNDEDKITNNKKNKDKKHKKSKKEKQSLKSNYYGQIGFIFYSIDQNNTVNFLQHESFKFSKSNQSEQNLNQTELEQQLEKYSNDMQILKQLLNNLKEQAKETTKKLKQTKSLLVQEKSHAIKSIKHDKLEEEQLEEDEPNHKKSKKSDKNNHRKK